MGTSPSDAPVGTRSTLFGRRVQRLGVHDGAQIGRGSGQTVEASVKLICYINSEINLINCASPVCVSSVGDNHEATSKKLGTILITSCLISNYPTNDICVPNSNIS